MRLVFALVKPNQPPPLGQEAAGYKDYLAKT